MDRKSQHTGFEVSKRAVDSGYFRDCYNSYGLFNFLRTNLNEEFSWWQFAGNKRWFDKDNNMTVWGTIRFKRIFDSAKIELEALTDYYLDVHDFNTNKDIRKKLKKKEIKEYKDWLNLLISFLNLAIERKSKIIWSV